jgi:cytochrome P450
MPVDGFNPFEPGFTDDPYPHYRELREGDPVHQSPLGIFLLFRYGHVLHFLRDHELSADAANARPTPLDEMAAEVLGDRAERGSQAMLNRDPPDHTRLRRLVSKAFTPRMIEELRPHIQELVDGALDRAADQGGMDLIADLAFPLPFAVISEMLGTPEVDHDQLRQWSGALVRTLEPVVDPAQLQAIADASDNMRALLTDIITWKRRSPAGDLLSALIAAEDHGDVLSDDELLDQVMLLYIAGHETTVNLIGNGTLALLRHPDQLERLRADDSVAAGAIDELLRYDSPVQMSRRITKADVEVDGHKIEEGTFVVVVLGSANRDPDHWGESADELDLSRPAAGEHLSFGGGVHYCLGAALARLEARVAITTLVRRFPRLEQAGDPVWNGRINLRGLDRLALSVS